MSYEKSWYGTLTLDNLKDVTDKIHRVLNGKKYTWVAVNMVYNDSNPGYLTGRPEVRASQYLTDNNPKVWFDDEQNPPRFGGVHFNDSYGVWGLSVSREPGERPYSEPYVVVEHDKVEIVHRAPMGHVLYWTLAVEKVK